MRLTMHAFPPGQTSQICKSSCSTIALKGRLFRPSFFLNVFCLIICIFLGANKLNMKRKVLTL